MMFLISLWRIIKDKMQSPLGFGNTENSWWTPFPHGQKPLGTESWAGRQEVKGLLLWPHPGTMCSFRDGLGHQVPGAQQLQTRPANTQRYSNCRAALQDTWTRRHQQLRLPLDEGLHWHRKCPSIPNCKYPTSAPWARPGNKAKGSVLEAGRAQAWLQQGCGPTVTSQLPLLHLDMLCMETEAAAKILSGLQAGDAGEQPLVPRPS